MHTVALGSNLQSDPACPRAVTRGLEFADACEKIARDTNGERTVAAAHKDVNRGLFITHWVPPSSLIFAAGARSIRRLRRFLCWIPASFGLALGPARLSPEQARGQALTSARMTDAVFRRHLQSAEVARASRSSALHFSRARERDLPRYKETGYPTTSFAPTESDDLDRFVPCGSANAGEQLPT